MRFALTDDQRALESGVRELLADRMTAEQLRKAWSSPGERTQPIWSQLAELGVFAVLLPEDGGGLGLGGVEAALIAEALGHWAVPGPVVETAFLAPYAITRWGTDAARSWLDGIAEGGTVIGIQLGDDRLIPDADLADLVLVPDGEVVRWATGNQLQLVEQPQVDGTRRFYSSAVDLTGLPVAVEEPGGSALRAAAMVLTAAQLIGAGRAVLDQAVAYAGDRKQFGRVIGSFQGLKHQLADVRIALDFAWPLTLRAAYELDDCPATLSRDAAAAKASAADTARMAARTALQVHGAIGYTEELDLQLWLKRIWSLCPQWGTPSQHRSAVLSGLTGSHRPPRFP
jgi:alkylation response protein AidB-like acyl-CoA dehydrogenase